MAKRKIKVQSLADTGKVPSTKSKVSKAIQLYKTVTAGGNIRRSYWAAILVATNQVTMDDTGELTKCKGKRTQVDVDNSWKLLAIPHHVGLGNFSKSTGITQNGVDYINNKELPYTVLPKEANAFVKKITANKAPEGYTAITQPK